MRRWLFVILLLIIVLAGCQGEEQMQLPEKPMREIFLPMLPRGYDTWVEHYGDSDMTALGFTVRVLIESHNQQVVEITGLQVRIEELEKLKEKKG